MTRTPNFEQKLAIEHHGGVLLSAGAGSGKTFVLVEHLVYLVEEFATAHAHDLEAHPEKFQRDLRNYFSQIVLMTFTKKAAGELSLRIKKRFDQQLRDEKTRGVWLYAKESLSAVTVGTIHSFCHKALTSGDIADFDSMLEITSEMDLHYKIEKLFDSWYLSLSDQDVESQTVKLFLANRKSLVKSLNQIFSAPEIRLMWKRLDDAHLLGGKIETLLHDCYRLLEFHQLFHGPIALPEYKGKAKWPEYLTCFNQLVLDFPPYSVENLEKYKVFFETNSGIRAPSTNSGFDYIIDHMSQMKQFRQFITDYYESFEAFEQHRQTTLIDWGSLFKKIVTYIEENYRSIDGFNFSDLEYYLMLALDDDCVVNRLAEKYRYFIVDEFQDTSEIQYHLLSRLIKGDFSRLFCVGDKKQAIYGFRGGELGVFEQCSEAVSKQLSMTQNYRSAPRIIDCNNQLFQFLFSKGMGFEGVDPFAIDVDPQHYPHMLDDESARGNLVRINATSDDAEWSRISSAEAAVIEAERFIEFIVTYRQQSPKKTLAVLYSKLASSRYLIAMLIAKGVGFTAQIKVPLASDPVLGIFKVLLQGYLTTRSSKEDDSWSYIQTLLHGHFHYLNIELPAQLRSSVDRWQSQLQHLGIEQSTLNFFYSLGIHNSNYNNNLKIISNLCRLSRGDIEHCYQWLENQSEGSYSIDFQIGESSDRIQLMTVHASKGLEFDCVLLGGINTNGLARSDGNYFGKNPGSFRWKVDPIQRKPYLTPEYILEGLIGKRKDFAESKRLFYVACTRAIETLVWVDIHKHNGPFSSGDNSWIDGLRLWHEHTSGTDMMLHVASSEQRHNIQRLHTGNLVHQLPVKSPLFHLDNLGIISRQTEGEFGTIPELSVTRLSLLVKCPFKFYLKNICGLDELKDDLSGADEKIQREERLFIGQEHLEALALTSDERMKRGSTIHSAIEKYLREGVRGELYADCISYVEQELEKYRMHFGEPQLLIEVPMKFPLFGQTINGIPDLLLLGKRVQVWDFKTGKRQAQSEESYWFQLRCYAYSLYLAGKWGDSSTIDLMLIYVDSKETVLRQESFEELSHHLFSIWKKTANLSERSQDCRYCGYAPICHQSV